MLMYQHMLPLLIQTSARNLKDLIFYMVLRMVQENIYSFLIIYNQH